MKKWQKNVQTLKFKIIIMLIIISCLPVIFTGVRTYLSSRNVLENKLKSTSSQTVQEITRGFDTYFLAMSNLVKVMATNTDIVAADNETVFETAKGLIKNVKDTDPNIINVFVGTEKGMFYVEPYAELPADYDHKTRDWYKLAVQDPGKVILTDPYIDTASKKIVVTMATAILDGNQLVGVAGIDIDMAVYSQSLSDIKVGDSGYIIVTDKNGTIVANPDSKLIGTSAADIDTYWSKVKDNQSGFTTYEEKSGEKFASYSTSGNLGWKVIACMDYKELSKDTNTIIKDLILAIIFVVILAVAAAVLFSIPISRNVNKLLGAFSKVAQGDMTASVTIKSRDEFRFLGEHFNGMVSNVSELLNNVNEASITVSDTSATLASMAGETNSAVDEVARAVQEVANGATEQAQNASDGAFSVSELSEKMNKIEATTNQIDNLSQNATGLTKQGLDRVEDLMKKSDHTAQSTARVSELVYETSESMNQIDAISDTIDAITEQTNLLALNASIEAARAGESGKGFAVVANEIRKLAEQSKNSTVKIKSIVEEISKKNALSVQAMEATDQSVKEQVALVAQTQNVFRDIMQAVDDLSKMVSEIKESTYDVAAKKDNIVTQIENIAAISEESASATEEVTASTEEIAVTMDEITRYTVELKKLSETLRDKMNLFKFN